MPIEHLESFGGFAVRDYDAAQGIQDTANTIYRLRKDQEAAAPVKRGFFGRKITPPPPVDPLESILADKASSGLQGIVYGSWIADFDTSGDSTEIVGQLAGAASRLPNLKALFVGDMTSEECEISWIKQCDVTPLLRAYPQLQHFGARGSDGLGLGPIRHAQLKSLVIECGGMPVSLLRAVLQSEFPALERLELYLGEANYGADFAVADLEPLLSGIIFPKLRSLGLRDSELADEIAAAVATAPILSRLELLDLSLGNMSDVGAQALLKSPGLVRLPLLDLHHHYISPELVNKLKKSGPKIDVSDPKEADEHGGETYRYIAVGE